MGKQSRRPRAGRGATAIGHAHTDGGACQYCQPDGQRKLMGAALVMQRTGLCPKCGKAMIPDGPNGIACPDGHFGMSWSGS